MDRHTFTLQGLKRQHADLGGLILANKREAESLAESMRHCLAKL
jgi:hypothetical protein